MESEKTSSLPLDESVELASAVARVAEKLYGYEGLMNWDSSIPMECRVVSFTWSAVGHAECNGYVAFLMMNCDHDALALCFHELGLHDLALMIEQMLAPIPKEEVLGDMDALEQHFGGWENFADWAGQFESSLFGGFDRIVHSTANYCRTHASILRHLSPEIEVLLSGNSLNP